MGLINQKVSTAKNGSKILIRSAAIKDSKQLLDLMYNISKERVYALLEPEEFKETVKSYRNRIKRYKAAEGKLYIVAESKNIIIGFLQFDNFDFRKCRHNGFLTIFISKPWRDKGIGKLLMSELIEWAASTNLIEKISLSVFSTNPRAIALYRKMGFRQEGRCRGDMKINGKYVDSVLMYKFIKSYKN